MIIKSCIKWPNFNIFAFFQFTVISSYNKLSFDIKTNSQTKSKPHYFVYLKRDIVCSISCANTSCASGHISAAVVDIKRKSVIVKVNIILLCGLVLNTNVYTWICPIIDWIIQLRKYVLTRRKCWRNLLNTLYLSSNIQNNEVLI